MSTQVILLVEDNEDDVFLFRRALKAAAIVTPVVIKEDGQLAIDYLSSLNPSSVSQIPAAVFLDLKLPIKSGFAVLSWIREQPNLRSLPVVILSSSDEPADRHEALRLGVQGYEVKPLTPARLLALATQLKWDWLRFSPPAPSPPA